MIETSILTNFNLLEKKPSFEFDVIITNPPFSKSLEFVSKCYEYQKPFALLLPIESIAGRKRVQLFRKHGVDLLIPDTRIDFTGKNNNPRITCWFCHQLLPAQIIHFKLLKDQGTYRQKQNIHTEQVLIDDFCDNTGGIII